MADVTYSLNDAVRDGAIVPVGPPWVHFRGRPVTHITASVRDVLRQAVRDATREHGWKHDALKIAEVGAMSIIVGALRDQATEPGDVAGVIYESPEYLALGDRPVWAQRSEDDGWTLMLPEDY